MNKIIKMDKKLKKDIKEILDYLWDDEEDHYAEEYSDDDGNVPEGKKHIFTTIKRIKEALKKE